MQPDSFGIFDNSLNLGVALNSTLQGCVDACTDDCVAFSRETEIPAAGVGMCYFKQAGPPPTRVLPSTQWTTYIVRCDTLELGESGGWPLKREKVLASDSRSFPSMAVPCRSYSV